MDRAPVPPESSYLAEVGRAFQEALLQALLRGARMLHLPKGAFLVLVAVAAVLALLLILHALGPRLRRRPPSLEAGVLASSPAAPASLLDAGGWRAELERRLAAGAIPEALEALWWWLARSLAGAAAEPDWTSRDLVARSRREDLRPLVRRLDAYRYGPLPPAAEDLRGLVGRLEETLA